MSDATKKQPAKTASGGMWSQPNEVLPLSAVTKEDEETITMISPRAFVLTLSHSRRVQFKAGVQEVPVHLATHFYVKAHGVKPYDGATGKAKQEPTPDIPPPPDPDQIPYELTEEMLRFVQLRGYEIESVEGLRDFLLNMPDQAQRNAFKQDFDTWQKAESGDSNAASDDLADDEPASTDDANNADAGDQSKPDKPAAKVSKSKKK